MSLRIVFMGTPAFALSSLHALVMAGHNIVAVVTSPDKPAGRGMQLQQCAVKKYAVVHGLKVLQPEKLKDPAFISELRALNADLQVVVAFRMLPEIVWNMPPMGTINVHASLLPHYRGAAPINWAIINGERYSGVTTFKLKHEIDTGNILLQERVDISENCTAGELHDMLMEAGAALLARTIKGLEEKTLQETPQLITDNAQPLPTAPKIYTATCNIDWNKPITEVYNLIRGLSPYPAAFTSLEQKKIKIFSAEKQPGKDNEACGHFITDGKSYLKFACQDGYISVSEIQMEGKKRMTVGDFLRGYHFGV